MSKELPKLNTWLNVNDDKLVIQLFIFDDIRIYEGQIHELEKFLSKKDKLKQIYDHKITSIDYEYVPLDEKLSIIVAKLQVDFNLGVI